MPKILPSLKNSTQGQTILVILLVIAVILTVGLSIVSRSVTDIKISQQSQEAARALWVAQAGLEQALRANAGIPGADNATLNNVQYAVDRAELSGTEFLFPEKLLAQESATLWLMGHLESTGALDPTTYYQGQRLTLYWGEGGEKPAVEASLIYKDAAGNFLFQRYTFDANANRAANETHFTTVGGSGTIKGKTLSYSGVLNLPNLAAGNVPYLLRIKLLFNNSPQSVGVLTDAGLSLPKQGNCFTSTAKVVESGVTRKLQQCQLWPTTPGIFDNVLFSGGNI